MVSSCDVCMDFFSKMLFYLSSLLKKELSTISKCSSSFYLEGNQRLMSFTDLGATSQIYLKIFSCEVPVLFLIGFLWL